MQVLVDVANRLQLNRIHRPNPPLIHDAIERFMTEATHALLRCSSRVFDEFRFRFYDGWYDEECNGTEILNLVKKVARDEFPVRTRSARWFLEIVEGLAVLDFEKFSHTYRTCSGIGNRQIIKIQDGQPDSCRHPANCPISELRSWIKGGCPRKPECRTQIDCVTKTSFQKLVDTSIVADAIWYAVSGDEVAVVSDDEDMIPGLLVAKELTGRVLWVGRPAKPRHHYDRILATKGVEYLQC